MNKMVYEHCPRSCRICTKIPTTIPSNFPSEPPTLTLTNVPSTTNIPSLTPSNNTESAIIHKRTSPPFSFNLKNKTSTAIVCAFVAGILFSLILLIAATGHRGKKSGKTKKKRIKRKKCNKKCKKKPLGSSRKNINALPVDGKLLIRFSEKNTCGGVRLFNPVN